MLDLVMFLSEFYFRFCANKVLNMSVNKPDAGNEHTSVFSQPYNTTEFYIGLCLAVSSTVFIGKFSSWFNHWYAFVSILITSVEN